VPGPSGLATLGPTLTAFRDPLGMMTRLRAEHGGLVRFRLGPQLMFLLGDPDDVRHVLQENHRNYVKSRHYEPLKRVLGDGLVTLEGEQWRARRRLAQPAFHADRLRGFAELMATESRGMIDGWPSGPGARLDVHREMMRLTLRIVLRALFSADLEVDHDEVSRAIAEGMAHVDSRAAALGVPLWVPLPQHFRFRAARRTLDRLVYRVIDERRRRDDDPGDLLSMLMSARDEAGGGALSDRALRDEVATLVLAGHETTAVALSWAVVLLSRHPGVCRAVEAEVDGVLAGRAPDLADLPRLELVERVISETMRLYPPVWVFERQALAADELGGHAIPAGAAVVVCPYTLHRDPRFWDNPEGFDPDRFAPERAKPRPRHAYLPFGAGPRVCIGNAFAMMEAKIALASIVQRCRLDLVAGERVVVDPSVTLRPRDGVPVVVTRRGREASDPGRRTSGSGEPRGPRPEA
jgi:cytochrome P450